MRRSLVLQAMLAALVWTLGVPAAHAFDLTGTWIGKYACKGFDGAKYKESRKPSVMRITQSGATLAVDIDSGDYVYNGRAVANLTKPDKGEAALIECGTSPVLASEYGEIMRAVVKTKPSKGTGSFSAISLFEGDDGIPYVGTCKFKYKRTDVADPGVNECI